MIVGEVRERLFVWEGEFDRSAGEVNERERGVGGVKPVGAADDQLHAVVQRLGSSVAQLQPSGGEDPVAVFADRAAEPDEWFQAAAGQAREQPVDQRRDGLLAQEPATRSKQGRRRRNRASAVALLLAVRAHPVLRARCLAVPALDGSEQRGATA